MDCYPEIARARRGISRTAIIASFVFLVLVASLIGIVKSIGPGLPECKPEDLAAALAKWEAAGVRDYDMVIQVSGRQSDEIKISVRNGVATAMTRRGIQPKQQRTWEPWTVPGMFDTIDIDFDNGKNAKEKFGVEPDAVRLRCEFDAELGYPKRYLHQVFGRQEDLEWAVTEFSKR